MSDTDSEDSPNIKRRRGYIECAFNFNFDLMNSLLLQWMHYRHYRPVTSIFVTDVGDEMCW